MRELRRLALLAAAVMVLAPMLLPLIVSISPVVYFDVDPRSAAGQAPITTLGPAGAAWLHTFSVAAAAAAVGVAAWSGGRVRWGACALFAIGAAFAAWHMTGPADDRVQCGAWIAAAALGLGAAHLAPFPDARRLMIAAAVAMLLPTFIQATWYVLVEHPMTVENYLANEAETLRSRGWVEGSPQHVKYRQRLTDASAVGAFGLSNVFASMLAALSVAAAAAAHGLFWNRSTRPWSLVAGALMLAGLVTLVLTQSKGGVAACVAGAGLLVLVLLARRWAWLRPVAPVAAVLLVALALASIGVRGALGPPETPAGERSLLFRYHYLQGAVGMLLDEPTRLLTGVGPTGFQHLYLQHKNPINPEEVTSTHSVFTDWITMLGIGGLAWSAMLLLWLWQGGRGATRCGDFEPPAAIGSTDQPDTEPTVDLRPIHFLPAGVLTVLIFGTQYALWIASWAIENALLWLAGAGGFAVAATLLWRSLTAAGRGWSAVAALVAAAAVLVHNQVEMAFYHLPSIAVVLGLVGLGANGAIHATSAPEPASKPEPSSKAREPADASPRRPPWLGGVVAAAGLLVIAGAMVVAYAGPETTRQAHLAAAAQALQYDRPAAALDALERAAAVGPADARVLRWRVSLHIDWAAALARAGRRDEAAAILRRAESAIAAADAPLAGPSPWRLRSALHVQAATLLDDPARLRDAVAALEEAIIRSPYNVQDHTELAALHARLGDAAAARAAAARAIELNAMNYLDPGKQLTPDEIDRLRERFDLDSGSASPVPTPDSRP